jgi:hypothetical protein
MDAIETETQTEPGMRGIETDMSGVGAETETPHELSDRCVYRWSGSRMSAPSLLHRAPPPSAPGCLLLSHPPARRTLPTSRLPRMLAFLMARQGAARGRGRKERERQKGSSGGKEGEEGERLEAPEPSAPGCLLLSHPPARHTLPTSHLLRMLAFLMARQEAARGRGRGSGRSRGAERGRGRERERGRGAGSGRGRGRGSGIGRAGESGAAT